MNSKEKRVTNVTLRTIAVFLWACLIGGAAIAGEEHRMRIEIDIDNRGQDQQFIELEGRDADLDPELDAAN